MPHGSPQFTPQQLLNAGRRAEAEGKSEVAQQFYWYLNDQFGLTAEAAEGRNGLARLEAEGQQQRNVGILHTTRAGEARRSRPPASRERYQVGRALATLLTWSGWLVIAGAALSLAISLMPDLLQLPGAPPIPAALQSGQSPGTLLQAGAALIAGGISVLCAQAARALFDLATATRELAALERAKASGGRP